jgi:hypothetical protein
LACRNDNGCSGCHPSTLLSIKISLRLLSNCIIIIQVATGKILGV